MTILPVKFNFSDSYKKKSDTAENILVKGFCRQKIKITQFPDGFRPKYFFLSHLGT